ncbi:MAG: DNA-methyltransferase [Anaerolineae bacterium]
MNRIVYSDNLPVLRALPAAFTRMIYIDPPFNTGGRQVRQTLKVVPDADTGDRTGYQGNRYRTIRLGSMSFADQFDDFLSFMEPRLVEARRALTDDGSLFVHLDYREVHYCKVLLDGIFGRDSFINEIIWAYDYGARTRKRWPAKHDNILWYAKDPRAYIFNYDDIDRIPYMAPGLVGPDKASRGKTPTDTWWQTVVSTTGHEKTGYPTQKPLALLQRLVKTHSLPGDTVLDCFAGSGTLGEAAARLGREFLLVDDNPEAMAVMVRRLAFAQPQVDGWPVADAPGAATPA